MRIEKIVTQLKENKYIHYLFIIIIGLIISLPLLNIQIFETHDGTVHLIRIIGTFSSIKWGQIPPIMVPEFCSGAGYAVNLFYSLIVTCMPLLIKLVTPTYTMALKIFGIISIILSGITMYQFGYEVTKKRSIALFAGLIYMLAPYKLGNVYKRYAIGEFVALIFLPVLFKGLYNLVKGDGKKHYYIAIGASLLILSHTVTTLYAAIFSAVYLIFYLRKLQDNQVLKKIVINALFIILITVSFVAPLLEARFMAKYTIFDDTLMRTTSKFAAKNTLELSEFITDIGEENATTYIIGIPTILLLILSIYTIRKVDKKYKDFYIILLLFSFLSLYMTTKYFPWKIMPRLFCKIQYPWRMMGFFNFFSSILCGINLYIILNRITKKDIIKILIFLLLLAVTVTYSLNIVNQYKAEDNAEDIKYENSILKNLEISHMAVNRDYLPLKAILLQDTYMMEKETKTYVLEGSANIVKEEKDKLTDYIELEDIQADTILEFPFLFYPGYNITINQNGEVTKLKTIETENGYLGVKITKDIESAIINVEYKTTLTTTISYIVSGLSTIIFIVYIVKTKIGGKNRDD